MDPLDEAQARLTKVIAAGMPPDGVARQVGAIVAGWATEPEITPGLVRWRMERLWDTLTTEAADLRAALSDGQAADPGMVQRVVDAMNAAVATLEAALNG